MKILRKRGMKNRDLQGSNIQICLQLKFKINVTICKLQNEKNQDSWKWRNGIYISGSKSMFRVELSKSVQQV